MSRRSTALPRSASMAMPPPASTRIARPSSAVSNSAGSSSSAMPGDRRPSAKKAAPEKTEESNSAGEVNIRVVVRCRDRSEKELAERSPEVTSMNRRIGDQITIETIPAQPSSSASLLTGTAGNGDDAESRTYHFDKVFGPAADQAMVFDNVADDMLKDVLTGYNCTIFAYGQTGSGKTYTMQGDLELDELHLPKSTAGIVPRVLHRLFSQLESIEGIDYSVQCTYLELYNEELRDLLAHDYAAAPASSKQPMSNGQNNGPVGLKLQDTDKGLLIQGLEQKSIPDLDEALKLLRRGCKRRQTAATQMNNASSRSHTLFTITVSNGPIGNKGVMRVGKFNLVDLAGSENIGRSGAEGRQAREAGNINQSLLTLGRVIQGLIAEKRGHIPYRESKLTRLLKDSFEGKTKTCIVATISPTRSNIEETLSTLKYASDASKIRTKPEINAQMGKSTLIKDLISESNRLQAMVHTMMVKDGVHIPEDEWRKVMDEIKLLKEKCDRAELRLDATQVEKDTLQKGYDQLSLALRTVQEKLRVTEESEKRHIEESIQAKKELEEEKVVSAAHERGEAHLHDVATGLKQTVQETIRDVGGLHDKIDRKARVLDSNSQTAISFGQGQQQQLAGLQGELSALLHVRNSYGQALRSSIEAFVRESQESRDQDIQQLEAMAAGSEKQTASLERSIKRAMADGTATEQSILHIVEQWQASDRSRREQRAEQFTRMQQSVSANHFRRLEILDSVVQSLTGTVAEAVSLARAHEAAQASRRVQDLEAAVALAKSQIARLEERNRLLEQFGATTQAETASLRNGMLALLDTFGRNQEKSLSLVQEQMRSNGEACVADVRAHQEALRTEEKEREGASFLAGIERIEREGRMQQPEEEALGQTSRDEQAIWAQCSTEASEALEAESQAVEAVSEELKAVATSARTGVQARIVEQAKKLSSSREKTAELASAARQAREAAAAHVETVSAGLLESHAEFETDTFAPAHSSAANSLDAMVQSVAHFLQEGIREDLRTGATPQKRVRQVQETWPRTEPRDVLIASFRQRMLDAGVPTEPATVSSASQEQVADDAEGDDLASRSTSPTAESLSSSAESIGNAIPSGPINPLAQSTSSRGSAKENANPLGASQRGGSRSKIPSGLPTMEKRRTVSAKGEPAVAVPPLGEAGVNRPFRR